MNDLICLVGAFVILLVVGLITHQVSLWLDFTWPVIQEERAKKKAWDKYKVNYKRDGEPKAIDFLELK